MNLLDFSDEIIVNVLNYLDGNDLFSVSGTCCRLREIASDEFLWIRIDARGRPNSREKYEFCMENLHKRSRHFLVAGESRAKTFYKHPENIDVFSSLTVLALENMKFDGEQTPLSSFPAHLVELSLRRTHVHNYLTFVKGCSTRLQKLKVLILDQGFWFGSYILMPICKLPNLEILSLYMCRQLNNSDIGYISISSRYGFKALRILDLRGTYYSNEIVKSFHGSTTLSELYFQSSRSLYVDTAVRRIELLRGSEPQPYSFQDQIFIDNSDKGCMEKLFDGKCEIKYSEWDAMLHIALWMFSSQNDKIETPYVPPKSVLYQRPYVKCNCDKTEDRSSDSKTQLNAGEIGALKDYITSLKDKNKPVQYTDGYEKSRNRWVSNQMETDDEFMMFDSLNPHRFESLLLAVENREQKSRLAARDQSAQPSTSNRDPDTIPPPRKRRKLSADENEPQEAENEELQQPPRLEIEINVNALHAQVFARPAHFIRLGPAIMMGNKFAQLRFLSLRGYSHITDYDLSFLHETNLLLLDLTGTAVTAAAVSSFLTRNPNCRVVHPCQCTCFPNLHL